MLHIGADKTMLLFRTRVPTFVERERFGGVVVIVAPFCLKKSQSRSSPYVKDGLRTK